MHAFARGRGFREHAEADALHTAADHEPASDDHLTRSAHRHFDNAQRFVDDDEEFVGVLGAGREQVGGPVGTLVEASA